MSGGKKINCRYIMIMESFDKALSPDHIFGPTTIFLWEPKEVGGQACSSGDPEPFSFFGGVALPFVF